MIRYMGGLGQSSDPSGPSYDPEGLPLVPDLIEVITPETTAAGGRHEHLRGHEGEIAIRAWLGNPDDPKTEVGGVGWILAVDWVPYQLPTFVTPAFQGFISGHSTFSRAAAEVLTGVHRQRVLPRRRQRLHDRGRLPEVREGTDDRHPARVGDLLRRRRPGRPVAALGGIHIQADDFTGRIIGSQCGKEAWALALHYYDGTAS